ncbi:unnamed protein product [Blepharisma stoltei]|uniref:Uncharacterized protein n=1 Tax=Blepharisma stoltei TaxID=1481888 RepID=A0AAU9IFY8_9CILI|nr:unnamed protein product [Blepharisma stoltei]
MNSENSFTAALQKHKKLSISQFDLASDSSSQTETEFPSYEDVEEFTDDSNKTTLKLQSIIGTIKSTFVKIGVFYKTPESYEMNEMINNLNDLVEILCSELSIRNTLKPNIIQESEIFYKDENFTDRFSEAGITVFKKKGSDLISKIFKMPEPGLFLTQNDCKDLSSVMIGAIRDSGSNALQAEIQRLQEKLIFYGNELKECKKLIRIKEDEIDSLKSQLYNEKENETSRYKTKRKAKEIQKDSMNFWFGRISMKSRGSLSTQSNYSITNM